MDLLHGGHVTGSTLRGGGGHPPPRIPSRFRVLSVLVLGLASAGVVVVAQRSVPRAATLREPPFQMAHPVFATQDPAVVIYVSASCPWCQKELAAWDSLLASEQPGLRGPTVVMGPGAPEGWRGRLPLRLATSAVSDLDGSMGRELGVGAVPFRARVAAGGRVEAIAVGLTTREHRKLLLSFLNEFHPTAAEAP